MVAVEPISLLSWLRAQHIRYIFAYGPPHESGPTTSFTRPPLRTRRRGRRTTGDRDVKSKPFVWTKTADEILAKVAGFVSESLIRDTRHASYNPSVSRDLGDYSTKTSHLWRFGAQAEVSTPSAIPQPWGRTPQLLDPIRTEVR